jgi:general secretion pathway protein I
MKTDERTSGCSPLFNNRRKKKAGFTLLEVLVAMAILATTLVAVYQLQSQSISLAAEARFKTSAALLAQSKMADIETAASLTNRSEDGDFGPDYPQYSWRLEIADAEMPGFKKVEVTVLNNAFITGGRYSLILYKVTGI